MWVVVGWVTVGHNQFLNERQGGHNQFLNERQGGGRENPIEERKAIGKKDTLLVK